ncbi:MAG: Biopolymer transport protein ExbD/TolR [Burkholderiaceae bacterium]|nr:Biopolymer transport protein ExbD/TolR [Burkholderiaceae bacterium]
MNFRRGKGREDPEINLIPFIDVLLVILIFLMVSTTYSKFTELQITLPTADAQKMPERPQEISVAINARGEYAVNNVRVSYQDPLSLANDLRQAAGGAGSNPVVIIAADGDAPHQRVINVLEAARLAGLERLTFATQSRHGK